MENSTEASCIYERKDPSDLSLIKAAKKGKSSYAPSGMHVSALTIVLASLTSLLLGNRW